MDDASDSRDSESNVLTYARSGKSAWAPPPAWLRRGTVVVAALILGLFVLGLPPLAGGVDYTRDIPLGEAVRYAWGFGVAGTLDHPEVRRLAWFGPAALVGVVAFLSSCGVVAQRVAVAVNVGLAAWWLGRLWPAFAAVGPAVLAGSVVGRSDGETWSEGLVAYSAMGSWTTLWVVVSAVLMVRRWRGAGVVEVDERRDASVGQ